MKHRQRVKRHEADVTVLRAVPVTAAHRAQLDESAVEAAPATTYHARAVEPFRKCERCGLPTHRKDAICGKCLENPAQTSPAPKSYPSAADFAAWVELGSTMETGMREHERGLRTEARVLAERAQALMDESDGMLKQADEIAEHIDLLARLHS